jgi:hypothetical protein
MQTIFDRIFISKAEYLSVMTMHVSERVQNMFDIFDSTSKQTRSMDLSAFFSDVQQTLEQYQETIHVDTPDIISPLPASENSEFVDVMIDDRNIMIESNSLRAVRHVTYKFVESGYILQRDLATEKIFRKDKTTRYIRIFRIISYVNSMCLN